MRPTSQFPPYLYGYYPHSKQIDSISKLLSFIPTNCVRTNKTGGQNIAFTNQKWIGSIRSKFIDSMVLRFITSGSLVRLFIQCRWNCINLHMVIHYPLSLYYVCNTTVQCTVIYTGKICHSWNEFPLVGSWSALRPTVVREFHRQEKSDILEQTRSLSMPAVW